MRWLPLALELCALCSLGGASAGVASDPLGVASALERIRSRARTDLLPGLAFRRERAPGGGGSFPAAAPAGLLARAESLFSTHSLYWNFLPGLDVRISRSTKGSFSLDVQTSNDREDSRTFGLMRRRLKMILMPIMFKLGVITTLLAMLTIFALKGLTLGVIILVLTSAGLVSKLKHGHHHHGWEGYHEGYHEDHHKNVHVHIHPSEYGQHHHHPEYHDWHRSDPEMYHYAAQYYSSPPPWKYLPEYKASR